MRKKKLLSLLLVGAQLAALVSTAALPASAGDSDYADSMTISKTNIAPTIDGELDDTTWKMREFDGVASDGKDSVKYDIQWDDQYLYFAVAVENDDKLVAGSNGVGTSALWGAGDGVRFFFSPKKHLGDKKPAEGDLDFKVVIGKDGKSGNALLLFDDEVCAKARSVVDSLRGGGDHASDNFKVNIVSDTAWNMEMRIPWEDLRISPVDVGTNFAFDFRVENEMASGESFHLWTNNGITDVDNLWISTAYYGLAVLGDAPASSYAMTAPLVTTAPTIDADLSDWGELTQTMAEGEQGKDTGAFDVRHDNDYIYIATQISNHVGDVTDGTGWEQGDFISVYFDPTMHRGALTPFDPYYDLQIGYGYSSSGTPTVLFGGNTSVEVQNAIKEGGEAKCAASTGGWILEVKIPKSALHLENPYFGFDIQSENNPNKVFINWTDGSDFYLSTVDYGKLTLARDPATSLTTTVESLDIPLDTTMELTDIPFVLNGDEEIDASFYDMQISFEPEGIIGIEKGRFVGQSVGETDITFKVDEQSVTIPAVCKAIALITLDPIGAQEAYVDVEKTITVSATASAPTTLVYSATDLPDGATFDPDTQTFKWTPTMADIGDHNVTFTVADKDSSKSETVTITVKETPDITIEPIDDITVAAGKAVSFLFNASDSLGLPLTAECTNLPEGARLSSSSDKFFFTWIPTADQIGTYNLNFEFTNGSTSASTTVVIKVVDKIVDGISFDTIPNKSVIAGNTISFKVNATCSTGEPVSITATSLPSGATFDPETNTFEWATSSNLSTGSYVAAFSATAGEYSATLNVNIDVTNQSSGNSSSSSGGYYGGYGYVGSVTSATTGTDTTAQPSKYFKDMGGHLWASASVDLLYEYDIVKGVTADTYAPANNITRADFVLLLMRTFGFSGDASQNFSDVSASAYYAKEVAIARSVGLVNGSGNNQFNPTAPISRQDMMVMTNRALQLSGLATLDASETVIANYDDVANIASYATQSVANMVSASLIAGNNNQLNPTAYTTRAEVAVILHRMLQKYGTSLLN